ncbi:MAG: hypothetical protein ABJA87_06385 [bacterium]
MSEPDVRPAGEGVSDEEFARQVAGQTSSDLKAEDVFEREGDGTHDDGAATDLDPEDIA